jgi:hypothetical protein
VKNDTTLFTAFFASSAMGPAAETRGRDAARKKQMKENCIVVIVLGGLEWSVLLAG